MGTLQPLADGDYAALAAFRFALRRFLNFSEAAVKVAGVSPQQYQAMLAIRGRPKRELAIKELARELMLKPNGAVQLLDRLEILGIVQRRMAPKDRRSVIVRLTQRGERAIAFLAAEHLAELVRQRSLLVEILQRLKSIAG